jgi:hypothetical protein
MNNRFAGYADNGGVPFEKYTPAVATTAKPINRKPKGPRDVIDDEDVIIPAAKRGNNMTDYDTDISRGPYYSMIDRQARARQQQTGESYAKAFTECYTAPENIAIRDMAQYEHLAKAHDSAHGTKLSSIPTQSSPADVHKIVDKLALERQSRTGETYAKAYTEIYCNPENVALRKAAPMDAVQDDVDPSKRGDNPGPAHAELHRLVGDRMKSDPTLSYERAFVAEYLHPNNRRLKDRVDQESVLHAQRLSPAPAFPAYTAPGHSGEASNVGRSGAKPRGYAGG